MFGGGGGLNPRKMQKMMEQMGIDVTEIDAEEVIIRTAEEDLVFETPEVTRMDARGQQTYQIVGEPTSQERGAAIEAGAGDSSADESEAEGSAGAIPDSDVEIVAQRTGASEDEAREALEATDGDLAAAIDRLE